MNRNNSPQLPAYRPPFWLRGGHLQSIWPKLVRIGCPAYRRELLPDSLGATEVAYDFVDGKRPDAPLLMLFHGLEGSSASHYARALMFAAQRHGWHAWWRISVAAAKWKTAHPCFTTPVTAPKLHICCN